MGLLLRCVRDREEHAQIKEKLYTQICRLDPKLGLSFAR